MSTKQDRTAARTASDIERKYNFGKSFAEVFGLAQDAQDAATEAMDAAADAQNAAAEAQAAVGAIDHEAVFNLLTDNGKIQGIYKSEDGQIYINVSYLAAGIIASADGSVRIDLLNNCVEIDTSTGSGYPGKIQLSSGGIKGYGWDTDAEDYVETMLLSPGDNMGDAASSTTLTSWKSKAGLSLSSGLAGTPVSLGASLSPTYIRGNTITIGGKVVSWKDNGDGTFTLIGQ